MVKRKKPSLVIVGAGGHAKVVADIVLGSGKYRVAGATDSRGPKAGFDGVPVLGGDDALPALRKRGVKAAAVGIGSAQKTAPRRRLRLMLEGLGFELPVLIAPSAVVSPSASLFAGCQIMPGAIVNAGARIGAGAVINTAAVIEHDCVIGDDSYVAPGAIVGGGAKLGARVFIGMGAVVLQLVELGDAAVVGAGAVVTKGVRAGATVVGVPARELA
jgi:sugar O-acyltransferase (sialic acid O-acetyltransferase NeuD family)